MVMIARALMGEPQLLLLDEPSTGNAPRVIGELYVSLAQLLETGMTILVAEQNARAALRVALRALVLEDVILPWRDRRPICAEIAASSMPISVSAAKISIGRRRQRALEHREDFRRRRNLLQIDLLRRLHARGGSAPRSHPKSKRSSRCGRAAIEEGVFLIGCTNQVEA